MPDVGEILMKVGGVALLWLPLIMFGMLIYLLWRTLQVMPRVKTTHVQASARSSISWDHVAGLDEARAEMEEIVDFLRDSKRFALLGAAREDGGLVADVREIGARQARCLAGDGLEVDIRGKRLSARVDPENLLPTGEVGGCDKDLAVETTRAKERRVQVLEPVRRGDDDHPVGLAEPVELDEQLVQGLVVLAVEPRAGAAHADGVELVDEDDRRLVLASLVEELANAGSTEPGEHLDEGGGALRIEIRVGGVGNCLGEQRLAGARRPVEEDAFGDARAELPETTGVLEEIDDLLELGRGLIDSGDVVPADGGLRVGIDLGRLHARHERERAPQEVADEPEEEERKPGERDLPKRGQDVHDCLHPDLHRRGPPSTLRTYETSSSRGFERKERPTFAEGSPSVSTMSPVKSFSPRRRAEPTP